MKNKLTKISALLLSIFIVFSLSACGLDDISNTVDKIEDFESSIENNNSGESDKNNNASSETFNLDEIPDFHGDAYITINDNEPYFTEEEKNTKEIFENYSELDYLGRCGVAYATICKQLMPTEKRENISSIYPSGWKYNGKSNNNQYDKNMVDGTRIYNRCHLIGFQLAGENANKLNLITGTRYMNVDGMLPFENMVADYVKETDGTVLYRVTPIFDEDNLVASGVLMEAWSIDDNGDGVCFCVYCYNVQPGIIIDYKTGQNWISE